MQAFQLRLFGQVELRDSEGKALAFRTRKQLAVLVYLYLEARERGADRDLLVELLWSDVPVENGRHSLSQACTALRERLGEDAIERRGDQLRLVAPLVTDLDLVASEDNRLLDLTQPLRELDRAGSVEFAHWVERARVEVMRRARVALFEALKSARARGDLQAAYRTAHLLLQLDPTCALAVQVVAERTLLDGDTIGAIRTLRDYVQCVERELGTNPHPEITRLLGRLERGEGPPLLGEHVRGVHVLSRPEIFVGRERELASLESLWANMADVSYQACLITGPAGIGKSALLRRFATRVAARACPVFLVACQEIGQGIPFAAVSDLIRALVRDPGASGTDPRWLAEASRVSPGLRTTYPGIPEAPPAPADSVRVRVADALYHMLEAVAESGPVLLAFDDMQHMDHASRDVLFLLTRRLDAVRLLLAATERRDDGRVVSAAPESRVLSFGWRQVIELDPLERTEAMQLVAGVAESFGSIDEPIRDKIVSLGQGNPYYLEMLLADFRQYAADSLVVAEEIGRGPAPTWRPPETMRLAFARLYEGLSSDVQHILHVLAVAGRTLSVQEMVELLGLDKAGAHRAVLETIESGAIRVEGDRFYFKNELHRAYVYWAMPREARKYHHARLADLLSRRADFQRSLEASHHFARAEMRAEAIRAAVSGAQVAMARGALQEAEKNLSALMRAYPDLRRDPLVGLMLARALLAGGQYRNAVQQLVPIEAALDGTPEEAVAAQVRAEALHRGRLADDQAIQDAAERALSIARCSGTEAGHARALQLLAEIAYDRGQLDKLRDVQTAATEISKTAASAEGESLALLTTGYCLLILGDLQNARWTFEAAAPRLEALSLPGEYRRVLNGLGIALTGLTHFQEAELAFKNSVATAERIGDLDAARNVWSNIGALYHDVGAFAKAAESYRKALDCDDGSPSRITVDAYVNAILLAVDLGSLDEAEDLLRIADRCAAESRLWYDEVAARLARAHFLLARAQPEQAWTLVEQALAVTGDKAFYLTDYGLYGRLVRHFTWATQGGEAIQRMSDVLGREERGQVRIAHQVEIDCFNEWLASNRAVEVETTGAIERVRQLGLYGRLSRVIATNVFPPAGPTPEPGESSAALVARFFQLRDALPARSLLVGRQAGELGHSA